MKARFNSLYAMTLLVVATAANAAATTRFVDVNSPSPTAPYTNWLSAATNIQAAIDVATAGDEIVATNGTYATGGVAVFGTMTNRVAVTKAVIVRSVNGPEVTAIEGYQVPATTNGAAAIRCVYLANGATLSGFTLTNGATMDSDSDDEINEQMGGGVWCQSASATVTNCVLSGNSAYIGGGAYSGKFNNCTLTGNSATVGGGVYSSALNDSKLNGCILSGNSAVDGGGSHSCWLSNCLLNGNSARDGGGAFGGTLNDCTLSGNSALDGGGAYSAALNNCTLSSNSASLGGGANLGVLKNCTLSGNSANNGAGTYRSTVFGCAFQGNSAYYGGGSYQGTLNDCTLSGNSAVWQGGGAYQGTLKNCIIYFNAAPGGPNHFEGTLTYCCATPLPSGTGNFDADPQLASASHLSAGSPCIGAGLSSAASGQDIDGEFWLSPPSIGCDEYRSGSVTGSVDVAILASYTNVATGFPVDFTALISGRVSASRWEFGDGTIVSNRVYAAHAWTAPDDYPVVLRASNETYPDGVTATVTVHVVSQPIHHVALGVVAPAAPYSSWTTAATNIQDAVDEATVPGALILVSNGVHQTGGRVIHGALINRVAVSKAVTVRSVNGPAVTVIQGSAVPGDAAVRCVYLTNAATLSGFTLTNGATRTSGDADRERSGSGVWCESLFATVTHCVLSGNSAANSGGGVRSGTLEDCTLSGNTANYGGGAHWSALTRCTLNGNSALTEGGGANYCTLNDCTLTGNLALFGGGVENGTVNNCALIDNTAAWGAGADYAVLNNCVLSRNTAYYVGGGAYAGTLANCTLSGNSASYYGGGAADATLNNCIVYYNTAPSGANYSAGVLSYCCATPLPPGTNNFDLEPQLASASHLSATSPCIGVGLASFVRGVDVDGESWASPPSVGCDEFHAGSVTGPLDVTILASSTNVTTGFSVNFTALIAGRLTASRWEFNDGTIVSNRAYVARAWTSPGDFPVVLRAYNETYPGGLTATITVQVVSRPVHHVAAGTLAPVWPYNSWATAATNIQDAVDAASVSGALILVSNGVYQTGGRAAYGSLLTNRLLVVKPVIIQSVNGPELTIIEGHRVPGITNGDAAVRCALLMNGATLSGFTLTNGATRTAGEVHYDQSGGGAFCQSFGVTISNCVLSGNSAAGYGGGVWSGTLVDCTLIGNKANYGGGAEGSTLNDCTLTGNSAGSNGGAVDYSTLNRCTLTGNSAIYGGGAEYSTLNNCVLTGNSARYGGGADESALINCTISGNSATTRSGGAYYSTLTNCISYYNTAPVGSNHYFGTLSYCCAMPLPSGAGNFTNAPVFVDRAAGNFHLQFGSPCINVGTNASAFGPTDLEGNPRIADGRVDLGAYEFQSLDPFHVWLQQHGLASDGSADYTDPDGDRLNNWQEWRCLTNPTNSLSVLRLLSASRAGSNVTVLWESAAGVNYFLERSTNLAATPRFSLLATNLPGQPGTTTYTDTNAAALPPLFYRVGVGD